MLKRTLHLMILGVVCLLAIGCDSTDTVDNPPVPATLPTPFPGFTFVQLNSDTFELPAPNNILRNPTTGLISVPIPADASPALTATFEALNSINGFSTAGNIIVPFRGTIVESSVTNDTFQVFNSSNGARVNMAFTFATNATGSVIIATPIIALEEETTYVVVITDGITSALSGSPVLADNTINTLKRTTPIVDGAGNSLISVLSNADAQAAEVTRQLSQPGFALAEQLTGLSRDNFPYAFAFTTQSLYDTLTNIRTDIVTANRPMTNPLPMSLPLAGNNPPFGPPIPTVAQFYASLPAPLNAVPGTAAIGRIYLTQIEIPVFRTDITTGFWANPPVQTGTRQIPALVFLPAATSTNPGSPPVAPVIFQHGLGGNKILAAILAPSVCGTGQALVAIDLEQHGSLSAANTGVNANPALAAITPDPLFGGVPLDDVGRTLNLTNLRNSRDNLRQCSVNLYGLTQAIVSGQTNIDGAPGPELGAPVVNAAFPLPSYLGTSLGGIVGTVFHATEANIARSTMNVPGGRISALLLNSTNLSTNVIAGLAASGITQDSPLFGLFFIAAQTVVDDADPINYGRQGVSGTLRGGTGVSTLQQVYITDATVPPSAQYDLAIQNGQGASTPAFSQVDPVTTNTDAFAVLARTLVAAATSPFAGSGFYEVSSAGHNSILDPSVGPTLQIVTQALTFMGTGNIVGDAGLRARGVFQSVEGQSNPFEGWEPFKLSW